MSLSSPNPRFLNESGAMRFLLGVSTDPNTMLSAVMMASLGYCRGGVTEGSGEVGIVGRRRYAVQYQLGQTARRRGWKYADSTAPSSQISRRQGMRVRDLSLASFFFPPRAFRLPGQKYFDRPVSQDGRPLLSECLSQLVRFWRCAARSGRCMTEGHSARTDPYGRRGTTWRSCGIRDRWTLGAI